MTRPFFIARFRLTRAIAMGLLAFAMSLAVRAAADQIPPGWEASNMKPIPRNLRSIPFCFFSEVEDLAQFI